jgi:hypothetical protein
MVVFSTVALEAVVPLVAAAAAADDDAVAAATAAAAAAFSAATSSAKWPAPTNFPVRTLCSLAARAPHALFQFWCTSVSLLSGLSANHVGGTPLRAAATASAWSARIVHSQPSARDGDTYCTQSVTSHCSSA